MQRRTQGNTVVIVLLVVVIVALAAALGYFVWQYQQQKDRADSNNNAAANTTTGTSSPSLAVACGNLVLSKGSSEGTAGTMYWHAVITNGGAHTCTLSGYPAAYMTDSASTIVSAQSNALYSPSMVTLAAHGGKAHVVLGLPDPGNFDPSTTTCTAGASSVLKLYLPGLTSVLQASFGESACQGFSVTALQSGM